MATKIETFKRKAGEAITTWAADNVVPALDRILDEFEEGGLTAAFDQLAVEWGKAWPKIEEWLYVTVGPAMLDFGKAVGGAAGEALLSAFATALSNLPATIGRITGGLVSGGSAPSFEMPNAPSRPGPRGGSAGGSNMRAAGGPVWPNDTFLVGERGPELFTPKRHGTIIPNHALASRTEPQRIEVDFPDPREWAREAARALEAAMLQRLRSA